MTVSTPCRRLVDIIKFLSAEAPKRLFHKNKFHRQSRVAKNIQYSAILRLYFASSPPAALLQRFSILHLMPPSESFPLFPATLPHLCSEVSIHSCIPHIQVIWFYFLSLLNTSSPIHTCRGHVMWLSVYITFPVNVIKLGKLYWANSIPLQFAQ